MTKRNNNRTPSPRSLPRSLARRRLLLKLSNASLKSPVVVSVVNAVVVIVVAVVTVVVVPRTMALLSTSKMLLLSHPLVLPLKQPNNLHVLGNLRKSNGHGWTCIAFKKNKPTFILHDSNRQYKYTTLCLICCVARLCRKDLVAQLHIPHSSKSHTHTPPHNSNNKHFDFTLLYTRCAF